MWIWDMMRRRPKPALAKVNHPFVQMLDGPTADYRSLPTFACPCGATWVYMLARFDEDTRLPGLYLTDGLCAYCGSLITLPTPVDREIGHGM